MGDLVEVWRVTLGHRLFLKVEQVITGLTILVVPVTRHVTDDLLRVRADRAYVALFLAIPRITPQPQDNIVLGGVKHLIAFPFTLKRIFALKYFMKFFERVAQFDVHQVSGSQLISEAIEERLYLRRRLTAFLCEKLLDGIYGRNSLPGCSQRSRCQSKNCLKLRDVHSCPRVTVGTRRSTIDSRTEYRKSSKGVVSDFLTSEGTGGGTTAQERTKITFPTEAGQ